MREPANLLHNMSVPPTSVISFNGVISFDGIQKKAPKKIWKRVRKKPVIIAFKINPPEKKRSPSEILRDLGISGTAHPVSALYQLINKRAAELPLPDGCAVIDYQPDHMQKWRDELAQLAVLCKSSSSVWLRSKDPRLSLIDDRHSVSLFLPSGLMKA